MSQKGSSILSSDNPEIKYKKALMEIQKIHNANKMLKEQSEEIKHQLENQISELSQQCRHFEKEYENIKNQKSELEKYLQELQDSNTELRKQYHNLEREVAYLNDVLSEQNTELKKVNAFKDEKGLSALITSYEDKEINYRKDIVRQEEVIKTLKAACQNLQNELTEERRARFKYEDHNNSLKMEINRYRELNSSLIQKNQSILTNMLNRTSESRDKYRQAESIIHEFNRHLQILKSTKVEQQSNIKNVISVQSYEVVLQQKNKLSLECSKLKEQLEESHNRIKEMFEIEENFKKATIKAEKYQEECNMLKSKLIVVETKQIFDGSVAEDEQLKEFEDKVMVNIMQNDPLPAIKNSADSSHFLLMKSYISELKDKLGKVALAKKEVDKKYKSTKQKFHVKAERNLVLQEQNKILKGKVEGYERLTERLQFQLHRNMEIHQQEMGKMKNITNNIINKKSEETKIANVFIKSQLDLELDKFEKIEKGLRQEIETLKLEGSTQKIKNRDLEDKLQQANEFISIYKQKFNDLNAEHLELQEVNQNLEDSAAKYEQMYKEEKSKNEALLIQKQSLNNKINQLSQEFEKKRHQNDEDSKHRELNIDGEVRKLRAELAYSKQEAQQINAQLKQSKKQLEELKRKGQNQVRTDTAYYSNLERNYNEERQKNRVLESEIQTLKLRVDPLMIQNNKISTLEIGLMSKTDELNDQKRKSINLEKQINILEVEISEQKNQLELTKKENANLKNKLLEIGQESKKSQGLKELNGKRSLEKVNEELASIGSELREEKKSSLRYQNDLNSARSQIQALEDYIQQLKKKQSAIYEQLNQLTASYDSLSQQNERNKAELRFKTNLHETLSSEVSLAQQTIYKLNQQISELRIQIQSSQNQKSEMNRQLSSLKMYLPQIQDYVNNSKVTANLGWQEQRDRDNLFNFIQRVKKVVRTNDITQANASETKISQSNNYVLGSYNSNGLDGKYGDSSYGVEKYEQGKGTDLPFGRIYGQTDNYNFTLYS